MDIKIKEKNIKFKVRVSAVLIINNKLLVNKYSEDSFCLPGGYVEIGETSSEAIKREVKEELNIEVDVEKIMGICENFFVNSRKEMTHGIEFYYKVKPKDINNINLNNFDFVENDRGYKIVHHFRWLDINELENYKLLPKEIINYIKKKKENIFHRIIKLDDINEK